MSNINLNELAALQLVLEFVSVKDLLSSAMNQFAEQEDTHSKDNADVCFQSDCYILEIIQATSRTVMCESALLQSNMSREFLCRKRKLPHEHSILK